MPAHKNFTTHIAEAEAEALAKAEKTREEINNLSLAVPDAEVDAEEAQFAPEEIESRWKAGEDVPVSEYLEAQALAVKTKAMYDGKKTRLALLQRRTPLTEKVLADSVARAFERALPSIPVVTTFAGRGLPEPREAELPICVITQAKPTERKKDGTLSGEVSAVLYRTAAHRNLDARTVMSAGEALGFDLNIGGVSSNDHTGRDTAKVRVTRAFEENPVIVNVDDLAVAKVDQRLANTIAGAWRYEGSTLTRKGRQEVAGSHLAVYHNKAKVSRNEVLANGNRSLVLDVDLTVRQIQNTKDLHVKIEDACQRLVGEFWPGLGMLSEVSIDKGKKTRYADQWQAIISDGCTVSLTFKSRV